MRLKEPQDKIYKNFRIIFVYFFPKLYNYYKYTEILKLRKTRINETI